MKKLLNVLKVGVSKKEIPMYSSYIKFNDEFVCACNGHTFVIAKNEFPIKGCTNFYVLENAIKACNEPTILQDGDKLIIKEGGFKAELFIENIDFPEIPDVPDTFMTLDEEILIAITKAMAYIGNEYNNNYVYMHKNRVMATDTARVFMFSGDFNCISPIGINRTILTSLNKDARIGMYNNNIIVEVEDAKILFTTDSVEYYSEEDIIDVFKQKTKNIKELCNVAILQDAVNKVSTVLYKEDVAVCTLTNVDKKLTVSASSAINGVANSVIPSSTDDNFKMHINSKLIRSIDFDLTVYVPINEDLEAGFLYLCNDDTEVILMGWRI